MTKQGLCEHMIDHFETICVTYVEILRTKIFKAWITLSKYVCMLQMYMYCIS